MDSAPVSKPGNQHFVKHAHNSYHLKVWRVTSLVWSVAHRSNKAHCLMFPDKAEAWSHVSLLFPTGVHSWCYFPRITGHRSFWTVSKVTTFNISSDTRISIETQRVTVGSLEVGKWDKEQVPRNLGNSTDGQVLYQPAVFMRCWLYADPSTGCGGTGEGLDRVCSGASTMLSIWTETGKL